MDTYTQMNKIKELEEFFKFIEERDQKLWNSLLRIDAYRLE